MDKVNLDSSYVPPDVASLTNEWDKGVITGEHSGIDQIDHVFRWMRGHVNAIYGWSNDGKGTFFEGLSVTKAKRDNWKFCLFKQEDMNSVKTQSGIRLSAGEIYNNLIWMSTGITPYKHFSQRYRQAQLTLDQYYEALEWVEKQFFVVYPKDRRYGNVMDNFKFAYEKWGIDVFLVDPFKALILESDERGDYVLTKAFIQAKEFALETNTCFFFISHPRSMTDVKEKDGRYKVVNQFMQLGGSAWDINMDAQFSVYRPERHLDPNDPRVWFFNLKQRKSEIVGANKGVFEKIKFDYLKHRYFFDGICPIDGSMTQEAKESLYKQSNLEFQPVYAPKNDDELPF